MDHAESCGPPAPDLIHCSSSQHICISTRACNEGVHNEAHVAAARYAMAGSHITPTLYFHCSYNCRFTMCSNCCHSNNALAEAGSSTTTATRAARAPPPGRRNASNESTLDPIDGQIQFTRFLHTSRDMFGALINGLIDDGVVAPIGVLQVRIEGTRARGVWLRIKSPQGAYSRRPRLLCGVLFHIANTLLLLLRAWTFASASDVDRLSQAAAGLWIPASAGTRAELAGTYLP